MPFKLNRNWKIALITLGVVGITTAGGAFYTYHHVEKTADKIYTPRTHQNSHKELDKLQESKPFSIVFIIADKSAPESSTTIVTALNPNDHKSLLLSIPRETYMDGTTLTKLNASVDQSSIENTIGHLNKLLNVNLDHYITFEFTGLVKIIDTLGGIEVDNPTEFTASMPVSESESHDYHFDKGLNQVNGQQALAYASGGTKNQGSDSEKQLRQKQIVDGILKKLKTMQSLGSFPKILNDVSQNVKTDLSFDMFKEIFQTYQTAFDNIGQATLTVKNATVNGETQQLPEPAILKSTQDSLQTYLKK